jgi:hypothetical protein
MSVDIEVRFTDSQAARLAEHKRLTLVPTSAFIRLAVERALGNPIPVEAVVARPAPVLIAQKVSETNAD